MASQDVPSYRRLAPYLYLSDLLRGRRVLEIGSGDGVGAQYLARAGARWVLGVDRSRAAVDLAGDRLRLPNLEFHAADYGHLDVADGAFDAVCVPDANDLLRWPPFLEEARRVLARDGHLIAIARSLDSGRGLPYHEIVERLEPTFGRVHMMAISPFVGLSLVEYVDHDAEVSEVELDTSLAASERDDAPLGYVAVSGPLVGPPRGFLVVQLPAEEGVEAALEVVGGAAARGGAGAARLRDAEARAASASARVRELEAGAQAWLAPDRPGPGPLDEAEVDRRLAAQRGEVESEIRALQTRAVAAEEEVGRLTAQAARELGEARRALQSADAERDAALAARDGVLAARDEALAALSEALAGRDEALAGRDEALAARDEALAARDEALAARNEALAARNEALAGRDEALAARNEALAARDEADARAARIEVEAGRLRLRVEANGPELARVTAERQALQWKVAELEARLGLDQPQTPPDVLFGAAAARHEAEMQARLAELAERDALLEEMVAALERAEADRATAVEELRRVRATAERATTELGAFRARAARLEGELLRLGGRTAGPGEAWAAAAIAARGAASTPPEAPAPETKAAPAEDVEALRAALAARTAAAEKMASRWKEAEGKTDELWRKIGEMQRELEEQRAQAVENARAQRLAAQTALTRAMEEASRKLVSVRDEASRAARDRAELEGTVEELRAEIARLEAERAGAPATGEGASVGEQAAAAGVASPAEREGAPPESGAHAES